MIPGNRFLILCHFNVLNLLHMLNLIHISLSQYLNLIAKDTKNNNGSYLGGTPNK